MTRPATLAATFTMGFFAGALATDDWMGLLLAALAFYIIAAAVTQPHS